MNSFRALRTGLAGSVLLAVVVVIIFFRAAGGGGETVRGRQSLPHSLRARVVRTIDGDTAQMKFRGRVEDVRYIGIDTPESVDPDKPVQCFGPRASHFNERLVEGRRVRLVPGVEQRDVYGRLLAYVYLDGLLVNAEIIRRGFARPLTIRPNDLHSRLFSRLALNAARAGRGLWANCPV